MQMIGSVKSHKVLASGAAHLSTVNIGNVGKGCFRDQRSKDADYFCIGKTFSCLLYLAVFALAEPSLVKYPAGNDVAGGGLLGPGWCRLGN